MILVNTRPLEGTPFIAPYVPCPIDIVSQVLDIIGLDKDDAVLDLGFGDGCILFSCLEHAEKIIGVELDPLLFEHVRVKMMKKFETEFGFDDKKFKIFDRIPTFQEWNAYQKVAVLLNQDMFKLDLESLHVNIIILYLLPGGLQKLKPLLRKWLDITSSLNKKSRRLYTIDYQIPAAKAHNIIEMESSNGYSYKLYVYMNLNQ